MLALKKKKRRIFWGNFQHLSKKNLKKKISVEANQCTVGYINTLYLMVVPRLLLPIGKYDVCW
jgi:hypothetical protein